MPTGSDKLRKCVSLEYRKFRACYFTINLEVNSRSAINRNKPSLDQKFNLLLFKHYPNTNSLFSFPLMFGILEEKMVR